MIILLKEDMIIVIVDGGNKECEYTLDIYLPAKRSIKVISIMDEVTYNSWNGERGVYSNYLFIYLYRY